MLKACEKPQCFQDIKEDYLYLEGYDKSPYVHIAFSIQGDTVLFHMEVLRWSHNVLKNLYIDWDTFKTLMRKNGVKKIMITKKGLLTESFAKFLKKFGLSPPEQIMVATYDLR